MSIRETPSSGISCDSFNVTRSFMQSFFHKRFFFEKDYTVITIVMKLPLINIYISFQDVCNDNNFNEEIFILISKAFYLLFTAIFHGKIIFNKSGGLYRGGAK